uniref:Fibronectin type-III domain-containing protein n=1 Tax=Dicentrarchus labrax TaxID=13489 RepID=A0A8P4G5R4_DICLA
MVEWTQVPSADRYYLLVISQATGQTFNMTYTNFSTVVRNLHPSTNYDCYVYTVNSAGLGSRSKVRTITTLVEPPLNVRAIQTGRGTARITWDPVKDVLMYRCVILDIDEPNNKPSVYNVSDTKLDVHGILPCSTYRISVSSFNKFLVPSESTDYFYTTNKLTPVSSVTVDYTCTTQSVMVHWSAVFGADSYKATAMSHNGTELTCSSQTTSCLITELSCGETYVVNVTPMSESCKNMLNSTSATFETVPCPPKNLELLRDCSSEVIVFSWEHTNNTNYYIAKAVDSQGMVQECLTEDNSCYFTHTVCGRHYHFTVYSVTEGCRSGISSTVDISTAPCIPQNLQTAADCSTDLLLSKWDHAEGALRYTVEAFGNRGNNSKYTCNTTSNSCAISGIHCGEYLTIYITAFDDECASPRTLGPVADTVPCMPRNVSAVKECGGDSLTMTWLSESAIFYIAMVVDSNGVIHSCNSMDLTCMIEGLTCSTNYTAYVIASNLMCNSSKSEMIAVETAACPPDRVTASLDCAANEALISWRGQSRVNSYTATIVDENQGLLSCSSTNTSCRVPNLKCGKLYTVTVSYHDGMCPSTASESIYMKSVPCGPKVNANLDCQSRVLTVGWNGSSSAEGYITVISNSSRQMSYNTTEPKLRISTLECGLDYTLKVMSFNGTCVSRPSVLPVWKTPCVPTNVVVRRNCGQNFTQVTWKPSLGALSYQAAARNQDGLRLLCSSNETSCRLEGLTCSQVYSVRVIARGDNCTSNESSASILQTAPCPPSQLNASVNCADNSAMLTWSSSRNAVFYTGKAVSAGGHTVTCDARMNLGCQLNGLQCGKKYTFTVSASDGVCQSPDSKPVMHTTAPCAVQSVLNTLNCSTNVLTISWAPGSLPVNYTATAMATDGTALRCTTDNLSCMLTNLQCGQQYTVTVKATSSTCKGNSSVPEIVNSVPCVPVNVNGIVECSTNTLMASWDAAAGAESYISMLTGAGGFSTSCTSANQSCLFSSLQCAQTYMLSVVAVNDRCNSSNSAMISAKTAPCDPTNVTAAQHCLSGIVTVTWGASAGGNYYTVLAEAKGRVDTCNSFSTSCELTKLQCGEDYTVTVLAGDRNCNSSILTKTNMTTAPCAPVIQNHSLDCLSNHALVTWVKDEDAMNVMVNATSSKGHSTSCSSATNSSCVLNELKCGNTYTVQAVAQGVHCLSRPSSSFQIVTAPCTPANVEYTYSCDTGIAFLSWDETLGRNSFYAYVQSGDHMASCSTSQTDCALPSLLCGRMYDVNVIGVADHCNSSVPGVAQIQTAPCAPVNVSASLVCVNNTAAVSWQPSAGAVSYKVMAHGRDGDVKQCTTNDTSCFLPNMHCAETYVITVTPFSNRCKGFTSYPLSYIAGPCPPTDVHVSLQCTGNVGHVTWTAALQADLYVATAVDDHIHTCSSNGTSCSFTDFLCGETAAVTVVTIERDCMSKPSLPFTFQSVICPPTSVTGVTTCGNNDIKVSWDPSPESGASYFIHSKEDDGAAANYSTTQTSHVITGLQCGELYRLTVAAMDTECSSIFSEPIQTETAPCPPTNLTARADCGTNMGTLNWMESTHAISYTATVTGTHGHVVSCSSNTTTCSVKLECGHQYTAVVIASSATCNSSTGASLTFDSAPCLPDRVVADLDCNLNSFAVQWRGSIGDLDSYTAIAIGSDSSRETCNSATTNCTIQNLKCGLSYSIVVTTSSVDCGTINGSDYTVQSAPCKPDGVMVDLQCSTNQASVTWGNSGPDQTQVVSAVDSRGMITTCNSSSTNCTFDQLSCGERYTISVVGHTETCSSQSAVAAMLNTAPCVPTHLTARVDCDTSITGVTWDAARGATSYTVYARGNLGHNAECNNTDTNCNFYNLACGQDYNITVVARHDSCVSLISESIIATTVPCPSSGLQTDLDCDTNTALVSWTPGRGILYYNASADAFAIVHRQTCSSNGSSCNISSLRCGESYRLSVSGRGQNCPSSSQEWHRITTAPCPPTQLMVNSSCDSNNISVSWQASQGSFSYMAVAENAEGRQWSCNTSSTTCQISGLLCGQQYQVYAAGVDDQCIGAKSNIKIIQTAPCVPQNIQNDLDCLSGVLNVTWQSTGHFVQFRTSVVSSKGHVNICETNKHHCVVRNMQCGLTYNVTVVAQDEACNSSCSPTKQVLTAPCPLKTFYPNVNCTTGIVSVTWNTSVAGVVHTVSAVDAAGQRHNCTGTNSGCDLSTLECGMKYNVSVTPSLNGCVGRDSHTEMITTVPCVPHLSEVEIDCLTNSAWVIFEQSAGAEDYIVMATDSQGNVQMFECNSTSDEMCSVPPLMCSQNFTFTIKALDQQCSSAPSNAITSETAPCPPENVEKSVGCDNHTASISWSAVPGAVTYTATLEQINGGTTCCTTSDTGCDITDLPCGEMYILLVMAEGRTCNSSETEGQFVRTAPCVPQNLEASLSCSNNVASMSWNYNRGAGQLYRVSAVGTDGHVDECSSHENHCDLTGLRCGQYYTATVLAEDRDCMSKPSDSVTIKTVPCTPANVSSVVDCEANSLIVSWSESSGADSYIATVQDSNSQTTTCQGTTEGSCNVTGISCGQLYHVSVVSSDGYCDSPSTPVVDTPSVPCKPRHIKAVIDCYTQTALVGWFPSDGALMYMVTATTASGHNVTCKVNTSNCDLEGMLCGQSYSVSVKAVGESCSSIAYMTKQLVTEPCIPEHITTQYSLTIGQVQWDMTAGADYYTVEGVTEQGLMVSCITNDTYCPMYNMVCGQIYGINVIAHNSVCKDLSVSTETVTIMTEPCPPNNVQTTVQCDNDTGTVSWESSFGAVGYKASLAGRDGHALSCYTNNTFCNVEGLHCGTIYYTNVIAIGETLNSSTSTSVLLTSAPCMAENVVANLDCYNNTAEVSWSFATGADSYMVTAVGADGSWASCETDGQQCDLTELQCGQMYNVSLTTISDHCQTETHTNATFSTRPCTPLRVGVDLQCGLNTANMYWEEGEGVELYMATATDSMGMTLQCNSTNSTCQFPNLRCGETYEFSVTAYSNMCYSDISSSAEVQTDPCQPTGLAVSGSCDNETVVLDWSAADGASLYMVTATGDLGYVTSFRTDETTIEAELPCGQVFTFTVKALDDRCESPVSLPAVFKTGPCVPVHVRSFTHCENNLGSVSWAKSDGAESYMAIAVGLDGHTHMCTTNTTICSWDDLHCGEQYTIHIIANDYLCSSMPSNSTSIRMAPCIPQNLKSSLNCSTKVGSLTWNASETAEFYIVTAETNSGHKVQLSTNDTWTFISEFLCGQEYFLSVQAADSVCTSRPSNPSKLESVPCPPTGVSSFMNCLSNIAVVSWTGSAGADFYTATVTQEDGQSKSCWSDSEQCGMPNLHCGQNYTVTVVASNEKCDSDPSEANTLQSVPCVPTDVVVNIDCATNQSVVAWSASEGALSYKVSAQNTQGDLSLCESTDLMCTLTNLTCGQSYSVQVVAEDDICSSLPSPAIKFKSVPCIPDIGSVVLDCFTNSAILDWAFADGALSYTATGRASSGHVVTCSSNFTNCELQDLQCGQTYNVKTVASNENCSSLPSTSLQVESVPCPPEDVEPVLDCSTNTARIEWQASMGADSYIVQAFGVQEHESGCETDSQSCVLPDLMCGFTYNISVIAVNSMCNVSQSSITQLHAVPCVPQQVEAQVVCESGAVAVSWEPSKGALSYTTVAQGNGGYASTCNSSDTTCQFDDLLCGLNYSITVSALNEQCSSAESSAVELNTVPCVPQNVTAEMVCSSDTGVVSWEEGDAVSSYMVQAFGPDGHKAMCNSTETSCQLPNMHCGQLYNLTLTAEDGRCDNSHAYLNLQSVPCRPTNVKASLLCHSNSAAVTWEQASGALSYRAVGVTADGNHQTECNNTMTHCDLSNMQCGQTYNVSVFGQDESCSSVESDKAYVRTAPCPPHHVTVDSQCADGVMAVSWSPNPDAQYFHVAAVSNTGARLYCNSSGTTCSISNLPCGQTYNVTVMSVRDRCESKLSAVVETSSAPCVPRNPEGHLDCVTNSAWVTWDTSEGALSYSVLAEGVGGHNSSCTTGSSPCNVPDLKCATLYTFHVTAVNKYCQSNQSTTFELQTGPCALTSISAMTQCNSDTILVEWEMMDNTPLYLVTGEGDDQKLISCNSSSTSCELQDALCDMHYSIIVSTSSDKCSNLRSPPKKIKTAPCVPDNVTVVPSCEDRGATVTWRHSPVATSYLLMATGMDGHVASCNTLVNNCTLTDLHCGQHYNLTITATGENCTSPPSISSFRTVPCEPTGVAVVIDCETESAMLSWNAIDGAVEYFGCAQSMDGDALYCNSTDTFCTIEGLECGDIYNFSVEASNGVCNSSFSAPLQAGAAPCPPTALNVRMQKIDQNHWAMITWDSVNCSDVQYLVEITGHIQNNPQTMMEFSSYWWPRRYFEFPMPCSTAYNLTVRARNSAGISEPSSVFTGVTVPCAPQNVKYTGNRASAVLSWDASVFAMTYTVYNGSGAGRVELCSTTGLSCQLTNFDPGATEVTASNAEGESLPSRNITGPVRSRRRRDLRATEVFSRLDRGLEAPEGLNVTVSGVSLFVGWKTVRDATEYTLVIEEEQQANQPPRVRNVEVASIMLVKVRFGETQKYVKVC